MKEKEQGEKDQVSVLCDPASILQAAIEQIEVFTSHNVASLDVAENGKLIAMPSIGFKKVIKLAHSFIGSIFSRQMRQDQEKKLSQIKEEILHARDVIQSHSQLIEKLKGGNSSQQKLAQWALDTIQRYNAIVVNAPEAKAWTNYERNQLLLDDDIKGCEIRLPHVVSVKYVSGFESHSAQQTIKELSETLSTGIGRKGFCAISPIHKKSVQVMVDAFRMKALRKIQEHLAEQSSLKDILSLIKHTPIEINESDSDSITLMRQTLEMAPGSVITLTIAFKKPSSGAPLMSIPILEDVHLSIESTQTGFPYPSQYAACALADALVDANLLRSEQIPVFSAIEQRKKQAVQGLLLDRTLISRARQIYQLDKDAVEQDPQAFMQLHRQLSETIAAVCDSVSLSSMDFLDSFYSWVASTASCFETLVRVQQQILEYFIVRPFQRLQESWLSGDSRLRTGTYQDKLHMVTHLLEEERENAFKKLKEETLPQNDFIHWMGSILGRAGQAIILQYMSEKIVFTPPMLTLFEQKVQICAFQQLLVFLDELGDKAVEEKTTRRSIEDKIRSNIQVYKAESFEALEGLAADLTSELETYFNARFYAVRSFL